MSRQQDLEAVAGPGPTPRIWDCRAQVTDAGGALARSRRAGITRKGMRDKGSRAGLQRARA